MPLITEFLGWRHSVTADLAQTGRRKHSSNAGFQAKRVKIGDVKMVQPSWKSMKKQLE